VTEVQTDIELSHPAARVWRALTDRQLLPQWFAETELEPHVGARFQMRPVDLPGVDGPIDGELLELDEPHRMVMRWHEQERQSRVVWELTPTQKGCRLTFRQSCEQGRWEPEDRDRRQQSYEQMLAGRLPAVLDWLAFREVDLGATRLLPITALAAEAPPKRRARRGWLVVSVAAGLLVVGGGAATVLVRERGVEPASAMPGPALTDAADGGPVPVTASPSAQPRVKRPEPSASPSRATPTPTGPASSRASLTARYAMVSKRLFGYTGEIILKNDGDVATADWTVTITLPGDATVARTSGAEYRQSGRTVVFTGPAVGADRSISFQFEVTGETGLSKKQPDSCAVNGQPCTGF
jgi:uncharacterized protein YndB with AHSA1/START domain